MEMGQFVKMPLLVFSTSNGIINIQYFFLCIFNLTDFPRNIFVLPLQLHDRVNPLSDQFCL